MAPPKAPAKTPKPAEDSQPLNTGFAPQLPTPEGPKGSNGSDLPQIPATTRLEDRYPSDRRSAVAQFLAEWIAENLPPHQVRFPFRKMMEQCGIEDVRTLCDFIAPRNRKIANICRETLNKMEALDKDRERQRNPAGSGAA
jgi:hypothetical protein